MSYKMELIQTNWSIRPKSRM